MSYILDALKKANAERDRESGAPPGLHTQQAHATANALGSDSSGLKKQSVVRLALVTALVVCTLTIGVLLWPPQKTPVVVATTPTELLSNAPPTSSSTAIPVASDNIAPADEKRATATPVPSGTLSNSSPPARVTPAPMGLSLPSETPPEPTVIGPSRQEPLVDSTRPRPAPRPVAVVPDAPLVAPLPASAMAGLPPLVVSGSTYSDNPAYRMLIINGKVYREGESPAADVKLEQIKQKSALLRYKGSTYLLPY